MSILTPLYAEYGGLPAKGVGAAAGRDILSAEVLVNALGTAPNATINEMTNISIFLLNIDVLLRDQPKADGVDCR